MQTWLLVTGMISIAGALLSAAASPEMSNFGPVTLHGEVLSSDPVSRAMTIELKPLSGGVSQSADVNPDGSFDMRSLSPGTYDLIVSGSSGMSLYKEQVTLRNAIENLSFRLPPAPHSDPTGPDTVSLQQLQHKVPKAALKALSRGRSAVSRAQTREAEDSFREATNIDPGFVDPHIDLGALYASNGDLPKAVLEFRAALALDPEHRLALSNLCLVLAKLQEWDEAGRIARQALRADPRNSRVHYVLALSLVNTQSDSAEALEHLQRSASEIPMAHLVAAQLLIAAGRRVEARQHLQQYLQNASENDAHRSTVEALRRQLSE